MNLRNTVAEKAWSEKVSVLTPTFHVITYICLERAVSVAALCNPLYPRTSRCMS